MLAPQITNKETNIQHNIKVLDNILNITKHSTNDRQTKAKQYPENIIHMNKINIKHRRVGLPITCYLCNYERVDGMNRL